MSFSLMIHGGAGLLKGVPEQQQQAYHASLHTILASGKEMLEKGGSAFDTVEHCVMLLEEDPLFNAGRGSVLNEEGSVEMDAALMDGATLKAGSVAGIRNVKFPIHLARLVSEQTEHVMLIGSGAQEFARSQNIVFEDDAYFLTEHRKKQWEEAKKQDRVVLDHDTAKSEEKKFGTVGAVARDTQGNLAAATSTGGIVNKKFGRVGDSPIIGAGVYADNRTCAVSATGYGEQFIKTVLSKTVSDIIYFKKVDAQTAADEGIQYLVDSVKGLGGIIVIDSEGRTGCSFSTGGMIRGWLGPSGEITTALY